MSQYRHIEGIKSIEIGALYYISYITYIYCIYYIYYIFYIIYIVNVSYHIGITG